VTPLALRRSEPVASVIARVCARFGVTVRRFFSSFQIPALADARAVCAWILRWSGMSLPQIGKALGKHHSTIAWYIDRVIADEELRRTGAELLGEAQ